MNRRLKIITICNIIIIAILSFLIICLASEYSNNTFEQSNEVSMELETSNIDISTATSIIEEESIIEILPIALSYVIYEGNIEPILKTEKQFCISEIEVRQTIINQSKQFKYYDENNIYFQLLQQDIVTYTECLYYYEQQLQIIYSAWETMPEPTNIEETKAFIWAYLRSQGFNEYVCAGIMANIQAECGFQWNIYSPGYESYGICQWLLEYSNIANATLIEQLNFLVQTMPKQFNNPNFNQSYKNINYDTFIALQDEQEAAAAFMLIYERPANVNPIIRQQYATEIYNQFIG